MRRGLSGGVNPPKPKKKHGKEDDHLIPDDSWEIILVTYMDNFRDNISISEYMHLRGVSRKVLIFAEDCIKGLTKKIKISNREHSFHNDVSIFDNDNCEVFNGNLSVFTVGNAMRFLHKIGAHPIVLDLAGFNHGEDDAVLDALLPFETFKQIWLNEECRCRKDCLRIKRFCQMTDIFSISPSTFMENDHGVNSLTIDASFPKKCVDILIVRSGFGINRNHIFDVFTESIHFLARVLYIKRANKTRMEKRYFVAMMKHLRVEELIFLPEPDEQTLPDQIRFLPFLFPSAYSDLKFAQLEDRNPVEYWDDYDEKIKLKVLSYTAVDRIPCTAIVERICSWFETSKETLLIFPKPRSYREFLDDLCSLCSYLMKFDYPLISLRFNVLKSDAASQNLQNLFRETRSLLLENGFLYSGYNIGENSFDIEVEKNFFFKKIRVTQVEPPLPPPPSRQQLRREVEEEWAAFMNFADEVRGWIDGHDVGEHPADLHEI